jgi:hypothetical protein
MSTANAIIRTYFTEMNDFEREVYLRRALYDPGLEIGATTGGQSTGLLPVFSAASIKARTDALALLTAYGERLAALAGADAPTRFNAGSTVLGANLAGLAGTFEALGSPPAGEAADSTAAAYAGPISTIIGIFGEMILDSRRDRALIRAVNEGAPAVDTILNQIDADLRLVISPQRTTGLLQQLAGSVRYYNTNRASLTFPQRQALLSEVDSAASRYQAAVAGQPNEAVDGIRDAHAALVKYANSPRSPKDLVALSSAIETFNNRLRPIVESLRKLEEAEND